MHTRAARWMSRPEMGRFELQGFANQRPRFTETFDPMADALIAVLAARRLGLSLIWRRESQQEQARGPRR